MSDKKIIIYTDGSARGNPGPGGFGVILMFGSYVKEISAGYRLTTNNRMELLAVITALQSLKTNDFQINIYTDSKYLVNAIKEGWLEKWIKTDFKGGKKNKDLWVRYYQLARNFRIQFHWVKGHAENIHNNRCDFLATNAADGRNLLVDEEYEKSLKDEPKN